MQGAFLKRHKIPKPDGQPYTEQDIRVGENVSMYARVFRIVDADSFTRDYMSQQGIDLGPAEAVPADPYALKLAQKKLDSEQGQLRLSKMLDKAVLQSFYKEFSFSTSRMKKRSTSCCESTDIALPTRMKLQGAAAQLFLCTQMHLVGEDFEFCKGTNELGTGVNASSGILQQGRFQAYLLNSKKVKFPIQVD